MYFYFSFVQPHRNWQKLQWWWQWCVWAVHTRNKDNINPHYGSVNLKKKERKTVVRCYLHILCCYLVSAVVSLLFNFRLFHIHYYFMRVYNVRPLATDDSNISRNSVVLDFLVCRVCYTYAGGNDQHKSKKHVYYFPHSHTFHRNNNNEERSSESAKRLENEW